MAINTYRKHLIIIPEDKAYKDIAGGFINHDNVIDKNVAIAPLARGWHNLVNNDSLKEYEARLQIYPERHILLLLDLDKHPERHEGILDKIPVSIKDRIFILSALKEAEDIKRSLGIAHVEDIGKELAQSCYDNNYGTADSPWCCAQLEHNRGELIRLSESVRPFLFS